MPLIFVICYVTTPQLHRHSLQRVVRKRSPRLALQLFCCQTCGGTLEEVVQQQGHHLAYWCYMVICKGHQATRCSQRSIMHHGMHDILSWWITLTKFSKNIILLCRLTPNPSKKNQREKKTLLISREESFGNPKRMATNGLDSWLGSEMGLTCKHEFQSWTCVVVMKIWPPLKVEWENDLHTACKPHLSKRWKKLSKHNPPATFSPNFS